MRSKAWEALSRHIGTGRHSSNGELLLTVERRGGAGLVWPLTIADYTCHAWCNEESWCRWIAPILPAPALSEIDKMLLAPLTHWSWLPFTEALLEAGGTEIPQISVPAGGVITPDCEAVLTLVRAETRLSFRLMDWPAPWLIACSANWPLRAVTPVPPVAITVAVGWCTLPSCSLKKIKIGEGLLLSGPVDLTQGVAWLFQTRPLAKIRFSNANCAEIEETMAVNSEWPPETGSDANDIVVTVVAEIGQLMLPLERLATLAVGEILQGDSLFDGEVRLKVNGCYLGNGRLIEVSGQWVVHINRWFNQPLVTVPPLGANSDPVGPPPETPLLVTTGGAAKDIAVQALPDDEDSIKVTSSLNAANECIETKDTGTPITRRRGLSRRSTTGSITPPITTKRSANASVSSMALVTASEPPAFNEAIKTALNSVIETMAEPPGVNQSKPTEQSRAEQSKSKPGKKVEKPWPKQKESCRETDG